MTQVPEATRRWRCRQFAILLSAGLLAACQSDDNAALSKPSATTAAASAQAAGPAAVPDVVAYQHMVASATPLASEAGLDPDALVRDNYVRAVIRQNGGVIGRVQLGLTPDGGGDWTHRLLNGSLSGGVRTRPAIFTMMFMVPTSSR